MTTELGLYEGHNPAKRKESLSRTAEKHYIDSTPMDFAKNREGKIMAYYSGRLVEQYRKKRKAGLIHISLMFLGFLTKNTTASIASTQKGATTAKTV